MPPVPFTIAKLGRVLLPLCLLANVLLLLHYIGIDYRFLINSDSAVKNLLAQEIIETGNYFPPEWNYVNKDLWVYFTHTLILPLLPFARNAFALHAIAGVLTAAIILLSVWLVTGMLEQSLAVRLVALLVISGGISTNMAENLYGQGAYGTLFYLGGLLVWSYWRATAAAGRARWGWGLLLAALGVLLCWSNPSRAAAYFVAPLLAASLVLQWQDGTAAHGAGRRSAWRHAAWLGLFLLACGIGVLLNKQTLRHVHASEGLTQLLWLDFPGMLANAQAIVQGVLMLFEGVPAPATAVLSAKGVYMALRLAAALALLALLPWALYRGVRSGHAATRCFAVFTASALAISLFIVLTTGMADMHAPESAVRYLATPLLGALILLAGELARKDAAGPLRLLAGRFALLLLALAAPASYATYYQAGFFPGQAARENTAEDHAMQLLARKGLHYGYSTFWNAGRITVLSGQQIRARQIALVDGVPQPMRHLSSNRWYWPETWRGPTFLMLTAQEAAQLQPEKLFALTGQPSEQLDWHEWRIWIFPHNIARDLPWDSRYPPEYIAPVAPTQRPLANKE